MLLALLLLVVLVAIAGLALRHRLHEPSRCDTALERGPGPAVSPSSLCAQHPSLTRHAPRAPG